MDVIEIEEGWEKFLMTRIHDQVFLYPDEVKPNQMLIEKMKAYSWVQERHLDLPFPLVIPAASNELSRLQEFKSPKDKLNLLLNFSQIVADVVKKSSKENAGNDFLLPSLILVILRSQPINLIAHVKYIMRFRHPERLKGIYQFCLTNIMGAISFIYNLSPKSLTLTDEEKVLYIPSSSESSPKATSTTLPSQSQSNSEIQQFANNFTGFLGTIFKEVKAMSNDAAEGLKAMSNEAAEGVQGFVHKLAPPKLPGLISQPSPTLSSSNRSNLPSGSSLGSRDDEEFELQLAMALSLSLQESSLPPMQEEIFEIPAEISPSEDTTGTKQSSQETQDNQNTLGAPPADANSN
jgi:hypothetical protein